MIATLELLPGTTIKLDAEDIPRVTEHRWRWRSQPRKGRSYLVMANGSRIPLTSFIKAPMHGWRLFKRANGDEMDFTKANLVPVLRSAKARKAEEAAAKAAKEAATIKPLARSSATRALVLTDNLGHRFETHAEAEAWIMTHRDLDWMVLLQRAYAAAAKIPTQSASQSDQWNGVALQAGGVAPR